MTKYLFLLSIGPVQTFIAQARKTQDLFGGSRLLSDLVICAAKIAQENDVTLIFPNAIKEGQSVPNRFLGIIEDKGQDLQELGEKIEASVQTKFVEMALKALSKANIQSGKSFELTKPKGFDEQIKNHWDINWLFYPIENETYNTQHYKEVEALLSSVKNIRAFDQSPEKGRKCSLDGEKNALFFGKGSNSFHHQGQIIHNGIWINKNEGLSAVSLLKRYYGQEKSGRNGFPSTARIALLNVLKEKEPKLSTFKALFDEQPFDEELCYEENISENYLRKNGYGSVLDKCSISTLNNCRKQVLGDKLPKYYALVRFDADSMGKLLSGGLLKDKSQNLQDFQTKVSGLLSKFSEWVNQNIGEYEGKVVYAGGDDFLGFINLTCLFRVMKKLRLAFDTQVNQAIRSEIEQDFTFSAGIVIAHYKTPLSIVLQKSVEMEHLAKEKGDRDSFAIAALKKSGETHQCYFKWEIQKDDKNEQLLYYFDTIEKLTHLIGEDCSENFVRKLDTEFSKLTEDNGFFKYEDLVKEELKRLIKRSLYTDKKDKFQDIYDNVETLLPQKTRQSVDFEQFMNAMKIILFIKRTTKIKEENGVEV